MLYMSIMKLHMSTLAGILDDDYEMTKTYQFAVIPDVGLHHKYNNTSAQLGEVIMTLIHDFSKPWYYSLDA